MWHSIPYIDETALVVDYTVKRGGYRVSPPWLYNARITANYIRNAVEAKAHSLGKFEETPTPHFTAWFDVHETPPGYYTHRVGEDVSGD